jgi:hypothetical protein
MAGSSFSFSDTIGRVQATAFSRAFFRIQMKWISSALMCRTTPQSNATVSNYVAELANPRVLIVGDD